MRARPKDVKGAEGPPDDGIVINASSEEKKELNVIIRMEKTRNKFARIRCFQPGRAKGGLPVPSRVRLCKPGIFRNLLRGGRDDEIVGMSIASRTRARASRCPRTSARTRVAISVPCCAAHVCNIRIAQLQK